MNRHRGKHNHFLRRVGEFALDKLLLGGRFAKWSYRFGLQGTLCVTTHSVCLPEAQRLPRPLKIAFASDFHAGPTTDPRIFAELFERVAELQPDLLLLGGDFVSCNAEYITALFNLISCCDPPFGKYAVFGNHDLWVDDVYLARALAAANVNVLVNENIALPSPFESISICGTDDPWTGQPDAARTFNGADAVRVLLMHAPDGLLLLGEEKFDLAFAGHTHGGQIAMRDGSPIIVPHGPLGRKYCHGRYALENNGDLIVSRGIGCSTIPIRINADPELVICTIS